MSKVNNFDVLKKMAADNLDIRMSPDIVQSDLTKAGTRVTIGIAGDVVGLIARGELVGCLLLWNKKQFDETKQTLEDE